MEEVEVDTEVEAEVEAMARRKMMEVKVPVAAVMETTRKTSDAQRLARFAVTVT